MTRFRYSVKQKRKKMNNYAVIMAGGVGQRFWPKGTSKMPKQFIKIAHDKDSMIQQTFKRVERFINATKIYVVTNAAYKSLVRKQIPKIPEDNIICEPFGRNTAPCILLACIFLKQFNPKANVLVIPSDHVIDKLDEFESIVKCGLKFVEDNGGIVTLGITPTKPETGFGYIQYDNDNCSSIHIENGDGFGVNECVYKVKAFAEKPDIETAKAFLENGDFLWNSGMFIFRADTMIEEIERLMPDMFFQMNPLQDKLHDKDFDKHLEHAYSQIKGISIDYGIMEKTDKVHIIRSSFGWSDVGSWDEIYNMRKKDKQGNVKEGATVIINSSNCLVVNDQRIAALIGVKDLLVIDTDNGLLICKRGESQNVKEVVDYLKRKGLEKYL
jgi:mannose-1-phosphate guanylyltransferase